MFAYYLFRIVVRLFLIFYWHCAEMFSFLWQNHIWNFSKLIQQCKHLRNIKNIKNINESAFTLILKWIFPNTLSIIFKVWKKLIEISKYTLLLCLHTVWMYMYMYMYNSSSLRIGTNYNWYVWAETLQKTHFVVFFSTKIIVRSWWNRSNFYRHHFVLIMNWFNWFSLWFIYVELKTPTIWRNAHNLKWIGSARTLRRFHIY